MSLVGQDFRGHRESRALLADQDSLEPVGKMAAQEREVNFFFFFLNKVTIHIIVLKLLTVGGKR